MNYHNTTHSSGAELDRYETQAVSQEETILVYFRQINASLTPSDVCRFLFSNRVPITSVRRALTNLTNAGELRKTDMQKPGPLGRPEYLWQLPTGQQELFG